MGIRVSEEEEYEGVDIAECGMEAYPEFSNKEAQWVNNASIKKPQSVMIAVFLCL